MDYKEAVSTPLSEIIYKQENLTYEELNCLLLKKQEKPKHKVPILLSEFIDEVECRIYDCLDSIKEVYPDIKLNYNKLRIILEKTIKVEEIIDESYEDEYEDDIEYLYFDKLD